MNATANASNKLICETAWSSCCVYFIYETRSESWVVWCLRKRDKKKTQNQVNTQDCQWSWKLLHVCLCGSCVAGARVLGWKNIFIENGLCTHKTRAMHAVYHQFLLIVFLFSRLRWTTNLVVCDSIAIQGLLKKTAELISSAWRIPRCFLIESVTSFRKSRFGRSQRRTWFNKPHKNRRFNFPV